MMRLISLLLAFTISLAFAACGGSEDLPDVQGSITALRPSASVQGLIKRFPTLQVAAAEPDPAGVTLGGVGFAADGAYITVTFKGPPIITDRWQQNSLYVVDEATGTIFMDIPVTPILGPLFAKPNAADKWGYVMLLNYEGIIKAGSKVTAVLGDYKREHVTVELAPQGASQ